MNLKMAERLALRLMTKHGVSNWHFKWSKAKTSFGHCNYHTREIALSSVLTNIADDAHVRETILHEIAHAWTPGEHHSNVWADKCREIGGNGRRLATLEITDEQRPPKWVMVYGTYIVNRYYRKPNKSTFDRLADTWVKNRKEETYGKCKLIIWSDYVR